MANTKVTGDLIASGTITADNLVSGTLDALLNSYLTTNTYATQGYVTTAVNNLIAAAPASLDTLNELAAALNDNANFATTVTNSLATKLNLSGGTLTGNLGIGSAPSYTLDVNSGTSNVVARFESTDGTSAIMLKDNVGNVELSASGNSFSVQPGGGVASFIFDGNGHLTAKSGGVFYAENPAGGRFGAFYTDATGTIVSSFNGFGEPLYLSAPSSTGNIRFKTAGSEKVRLTSGGNLLINTQTDAGSPFNLQVNGRILQTGREFLLSGDEDKYITVYSNRSLLLRTNDDTKMIITGDGNVGISTTLPTSRLDVSSLTATTSNLGETSTGAINVRIGNTVGRVGQINFSNDAAPNYGYGGIGMVMTSGTGVGLADMLFYVKSTGSDAVSTERMRINSSGNVGIGTGTNIENDLHIQSSTPTIRLSDSDASNLTEVSSTIQYWQGNNTARAGYIGYGTVSNSSLTIKNEISDGDVIIAAGDQERVWFHSNGNTGFATSLNYGRLNIVGYDEYGINIIDQRTSSSGVFSSGITFRDYYLAEAASIDFYHNQYFGSGVRRIGFTISGGEKMSIRHNGDVGIGIESPTDKLHVFGSAPNIKIESNDLNTFHGIEYRPNGFNNKAGLIVNYNTGEFRHYVGELNNSYYHTFHTNGAERMELTNSYLNLFEYSYGSVDGFSLMSDGRMFNTINYNSYGAEIFLINNRTAGAVALMQYRTLGTVRGSIFADTGGLAFNNPSDYRLKDNVVPLVGSLQKITSLNPVSYTLNNVDEPIQKVGFIAHEVAEHIPSIVRGKKDDVYTQEDIDSGVSDVNVGDPKYQSLSYSSDEMITHLVGAIKELKAEVEALKQQISINN